MEFWEPILIAVVSLLAVLIVLVTISRWKDGSSICCCLSRQKNQSTLPRSIQHALTQLERVTEKRPKRNPQTESEDAECPICLGFLYPREARTSTSAVSHNAGDLESGLGGGITKTTTEVTTHEKDRQPEQPEQPIDDDVLIMKRCRHIFHARCLATWYLRRKYNCPVCREPYYQEETPMEPNHDYREQDYRIIHYLPAAPVW